MAKRQSQGSAATAMILVQTELPMPGAAAEGVVETLKKIGPEQLEAVGDVAHQIQAWLLTKLTGMSPKPSSVSLEFGIDVGGEAGVPFVTKGSIGANFKVGIEWKTSDT